MFESWHETAQGLVGGNDVDESAVEALFLSLARVAKARGYLGNREACHRDQIPGLENIQSLRDYIEVDKSF